MTVNQSTNGATGGIFSATGSLAFGNDPTNGNPTVTLPPVVATITGGNQASPSDDVIIRAHDVQACEVIDGTTGATIDVIPANMSRTYTATKSLTWQRSEGIIVVGGTASSPPANPNTPVRWLQLSTTNGQVLGKLPM